MHIWTRRQLLGLAGRHVESTCWVRLQVMELEVGQTRPFALDKGNLILTCLSGEAILKHAANETRLTQGDQVLAVAGDGFQLACACDEAVVLELIWAPGI